MGALKRKQPWPAGVDKGARTVMQTQDEQILMGGYVVEEFFYTPDIGRDKWEIWNLSDLKGIDVPALPNKENNEFEYDHLLKSEILETQDVLSSQQ